MKQPEIAVVFHSVCANTYLMAREYRDSFQKLGARVRFYRLRDPNYAVTCDAFPASREYKDAILAAEELVSPAQVLDCDALFLGSPTYFGNVSAPVKVFMDSFVDYWVEARLAGKYFGGFATAGTPQGGADICLQALGHFAMHMGMCVVSVPSTVAGGPQPAYGLAHYSGDGSDRRPGPECRKAIQSYCAYVYGTHLLGAAGRNRKEEGTV